MTDLDWSLSFFLISTGVGVSIFFVCFGISFILRYANASSGSNDVRDDKTVAKLIMFPGNNPLYDDFPEPDDDDGFH